MKVLHGLRILSVASLLILGLTAIAGAQAPARRTVSLPGAALDRVVPGSAADQAGLLRGDVILEIDGVRIDSYTDLIRTIRNSSGVLDLMVRDVYTHKPFFVYATLHNGRLGIESHIVTVPVHMSGVTAYSAAPGKSARSAPRGRPAR